MAARPRPDTFEINRMRDEFLEREPHFCFSKRFSDFFLVVAFFYWVVRVSQTEEQTQKGWKNRKYTDKCEIKQFNPMALKKGEYL